MGKETVEKKEKETDTTQRDSLTQSQKQEDQKKMNTTTEKKEKSEEEILVADSPLKNQHRLREANNIVRNRMIASVGAGLLPFPVIDLAALTALQLDTVRALSKLYDVKFSKNLGKTAISSLTGALFPVTTSPWIGSVVKTIPAVGQLMGAMTMPVVSGASTYALGKVFIQHFESGGTFLTFDPEKVRDYFQEEFEKGKEYAKGEAAKKA